MKDYTFVCHGADIDGWMSAAICVLSGEAEPGKNIVWYNYEPNLIDLLEGHRSDCCVFCDCAPALCCTESLLARYKEIIILDHHKTSANDFSEENLKKMFDGYTISLEVDNGNEYIVKTIKTGDKGSLTYVRSDKKFKAGCWLTWDYFFYDVEPSRAIQAISHYDTWSSDKAMWALGNYANLAIREFLLVDCMGSRDELIKYLPFLADKAAYAYKMRDTPIKDPFDHNGNPDGFSILEKGAFLAKVQDAKNAEIAKGAFEVEFEGKRWIAVNARGNSKIFDTVFNADKHFGMVLFGRELNKWKFSLYSVRNRDVSEIARKYGGGGHAQASGFSVDKLPEAFVG